MAEISQADNGKTPLIQAEGTDATDNQAEAIQEQHAGEADGVALEDQQASEAPAAANGKEEAHHEELAPPVQLSEFERELQKAKANPIDFNQWVAVEKLLEKEGSIEKTREVYDGFLAEYPLCYAYWKKYAEWEHKHSTPEWAISVYKRGTAAVPYSCDLWGHFAAYKQRISAPAEEIREVFENGAAYVGSDYLAHILWDKYLKFEQQHGTPAHIMRLYLQILGSPLRDLDRYYASFKQFAHSKGLAELIGEDEHAKTTELLRQARLAEAALKAETATPETEAAPAVKVEDGGAKAPGIKIDTQANGLERMDADAGAPSQAEGLGVETVDAGVAGTNQEAGESAAGAEVNVKAENGLEIAKAEGVEREPSQEEPEVTEEDVKAYWLSGITALHQETKEELTRKKAFEDLIKRPYFHVKPLPAVQLATWDSYIDYILTKEDAGSIVRLFERCLVACANYPEFWIRYVRYLVEADPENAKIAMQRAQQVHCKRDASLHLFAARFHERTGSMEAARDTYKLLLTHLAPDLVEAIVQAANFERRQSNLSAACQAFDTALEREDAKEGVSDTGAMIAMFYATFLFLDCQRASTARALYQRVLKRWNSLLYLWEAALHFEEHCFEDGREERVIQLYTDALASSADEAGLELSLDDRKLLSQRLVDFADRHCSPQRAYEFEGNHASLFSKYKMEAASKKRAADGTLTEPPSKKAAADAAQVSAASVPINQPAVQPAAPHTSGALAYPPFHDPAAYASQPMASGAPPSAHYPPGPGAAAYNAYGYGYQYPQQYGYSYAGYQ